MRWSHFCLPSSGRGYFHQRRASQVRYKDTWYWIDATDVRSKRAFSFMVMFFSQAETGTTPQAPLITVGAN
jgi:hypothetical protein